MGNTAKALLALVQRKSNHSFEDFAVALGASTDDEDKMRTNVDLLLKLLTTELANSGEWKLIEMANRHELKLVFHSSLSCGHRYNDRIVNQNSDTIEFTVPLDTTATSSNVAITEAELQRIMNGYNRQTMQVECGRCKTTVDLVCFFEVPHACDPDFLTLVCKPAINIMARQLELQFSRSCYVVKAVSHWDKQRKMGAVSREKTDGSWWYHGIVRDQAAHFQYTEDQLESGVHFKNVAVLFAVREEPRVEDHGEGVGEGENDADLLDMVGQNSNTSTRSQDEDISTKENTNSIEAEVQHPDPDQLGAGKQGNAKGIFNSRQVFLAALEEEQMRMAIQQSKVDPQPHQIQGLMVERGLRFMTERGFNLNSTRFVPMDGNCSFSMIALGRDPSLGALDLAMEATQLRTSSIAWAIEIIRALDEEGLEQVRLVATPETKFGELAVFLTREDLISGLERFADNGQYAGQLGDILVYILAAFLRVPILVVDVNHEASPLGLFVSPRTLFGREPETNVPLVGVRMGNHFEPLLVPEEAGTSLAEMFAAEEEQQQPADQICSASSRNRVSNDDEEIERQRMIPIATSTPVKDSDRGQSELSQNSPRRETSMFQDQDEQLQASLSSSVGMESTNYSTQVHSILFCCACFLVCNGASSSGSLP